MDLKFTCRLQNTIMMECCKDVLRTYYLDKNNVPQMSPKRPIHVGDKRGNWQLSLVLTMNLNLLTNNGLLLLFINFKTTLKLTCKCMYNTLSRTLKHLSTVKQNYEKQLVNLNCLCFQIGPRSS